MKITGLREAKSTARSESSFLATDRALLSTTTVMTRRRTFVYASLLLLAVAGCGDDGGTGGGDGAGDDAGPDVGDGLGGDNGFGGFGGDCSAEGPQCNDCVDNDEDGDIDGFDPECTGPADDDEGSFATGIPGDNKDAVKQDCFFDGNSGAGNDGCDIHVCCLLDLAAFGGECPEEFKPGQYEPDECAQTQMCIDECGAITPPGCDCFGCCTICNDAGCFDVLTNPAVAPNCDESVVDDPDACPTCIKNEECGGAECGGCVLCPGQDPSDLPPECNEEPVCPEGLTECPDGSGCAEGEFCSNGCCFGEIIVE